MSTRDLPGLPADAFQAWMRSALPGLEPLAGSDGEWTAEAISGGLSNLTYRVRWGSHRLILRRPPLGHLLPRAHDVQREYRVMSALGATPVPVPEAIAFCADRAVLGAPFYLMREVSGQVLRTAGDAQGLSPGQRESAGRELVDVLADLHAVDPDAVGLGDFGPRSDYAARQLRTWGKLAQRYAARTGRDMSSLLFYLALAAMKLAVIFEGVHSRYLAGNGDGAGYAAADDAVPVLTAYGLRLLRTPGARPAPAREAVPAAPEPVPAF
jgi:aminoglycoside phosphotransferase (APT) family kinase protein